MRLCRIRGTDVYEEVSVTKIGCLWVLLYSLLLILGVSLFFILVDIHGGVWYG